MALFKWNGHLVSEGKLKVVKSCISNIFSYVQTDYKMTGYRKVKTYEIMARQIVFMSHSILQLGLRQFVNVIIWLSNDFSIVHFLKSDLYKVTDWVNGGENNGFYSHGLLSNIQDYTCTFGEESFPLHHYQWWT